ncbi:hypothetical protein E2C01_079359 [Portunus trituberculatus]|uniref:Uncharacterized protein n=1 Tax=Portunus trituberculatus TaxID=210409 RepID=A0A5B7IQ41_PORTR|nr:hypothetical protein [Portunus trituberculatus]
MTRPNHTSSKMCETNYLLYVSNAIIRLSCLIYPLVDGTLIALQAMELDRVVMTLIKRSAPTVIVWQFHRWNGEHVVMTLPRLASPPRYTVLVREQFLVFFVSASLANR